MATIPAVFQTAALRTVPAPSNYDVGADIRNTLDTRERVYVIRAMLVAQRKAFHDAFLQTVSTEIAALPGAPDQGFIDAEYKKFVAWKTADAELAARIAAFEELGKDVEKRFRAFEKLYRDEVVALLKTRIALLKAQREAQESDEKALDERIESLSEELKKLSQSATAAASATSKARKRPAAKKKAMAKPKKGKAKKAT